MTKLTTTLATAATSKSSAFFCALLLSCVAAHQSAQLVWGFFSPQDTAQPWQPQLKPSTPTHKEFDLSQLTQAPVFGVYQREPVKAKPVAQVAAENAPKTKLRVSISGLMASNDASRALAIIEHRGQQGTYAIGEIIEGTKAEVKDILADRVIINNQGVLESIPLDVEDGSVPQLQRNTSRNTSSSARAQNDINIDRKDVIANFQQLINISPRKGDDGKIVGYTLNPGAKPEAFRAAGLRAGDLAIALNGFDLTDMGQAFQIMQELPNLTEASVTVERDGQLEEIFITMPE